MSKRVANSRGSHARNGRVRLGWRTVLIRQKTKGPKIHIEPVIRSSRIAKIKPKKTVWESFKSLFRRTQTR